MRIITWNIQHGGGSRIDRICDALHPYEADLIILAEFRHNKAANTLRDRLSEQGYAYQSAPHAPARSNIVFVAARQPFEAVTFPGQLDDTDGLCSALRASISRGIR